MDRRIQKVMEILLSSDGEILIVNHGLSFEKEFRDIKNHLLNKRISLEHILNCINILDDQISKYDYKFPSYCMKKNRQEIDYIDLFQQYYKTCQPKFLEHLNQAQLCNLTLQDVFAIIFLTALVHIILMVDSTAFFNNSLCIIEIIAKTKIASKAYENFSYRGIWPRTELVVSYNEFLKRATTLEPQTYEEQCFNLAQDRVRLYLESKSKGRKGSRGREKSYHLCRKFVEDQWVNKKLIYKTACRVAKEIYPMLEEQGFFNSPMKKTQYEGAINTIEIWINEVENPEIKEKKAQKKIKENSSKLIYNLGSLNKSHMNLPFN
jgi:hypothetical protein